jgi:hypothetical protein
LELNRLSIAPRFRGIKFMKSLAKKQSSTEKTTTNHKQATATSSLATKTHSLPLFSADSPLLKRKCACGGGCPRCRDEDTLLSKFKISEPEVTPSLESHIQQQQGLGQPIAETTRTKMESFFGADFSGVNIHTDNQAVQMNQSLNAQAFTVGNDIFFNFGKYTPGRATGDHLLAHELTHVIQQTEGRQPLIQRKSNEEQGCDGKVSDIFRLEATLPAEPSQYSTALITPSNQPDNRFSKLYHIGDYLNDYMVIVDIPSTDTFNYNLVRVMHCENLEILEAPQSKHIVEVRESNFGPGTVTTFDNCNQVEFEPEDKSKPRKVYILETLSKPGVEDLTGYVLQGSNDGSRYDPADLGRFLRVHLVKDKCGMPNPQEPSTNEGEGEKLP